MITFDRSLFLDGQSIIVFRNMTNYLFILGLGSNTDITTPSVVTTSTSSHVSSSIEVHAVSLNKTSGV